MPLTIDAAARTHIGLVRSRNEDTAYAGDFLFAVADGMGGHTAGDVASTTAVEALRPYDRPTEPTELAAELGKAVHDANEALRRRAVSSPELSGMGTTLVAMLVSGNAAALANVGDCRAYLLRGGRLVRLTEDHTYGNLVAEASQAPRLRERISRFLDGRPDGRSPDIIRKDLSPGDRLLMCSDGLSGEVPEARIRDALVTDDGPLRVAESLVELALEHGGRDNVTAVVLDTGVFDATTTTSRP